MNKQELLQELIQKVQMGEIRKEEVTLVMEQDNTSSVQIKSSVLHNPVISRYRFILPTNLYNYCVGFDIIAYDCNFKQL